MTVRRWGEGRFPVAVEGTFSDGITPRGKDGPEGPAGTRTGINDYTVGHHLFSAELVGLICDITADVAGADNDNLLADLHGIVALGRFQEIKGGNDTLLGGQHADAGNRHRAQFQARDHAHLPLRDARQHHDDTVAPGGLTCYRVFATAPGPAPPPPQP